MEDLLLAHMLECQEQLIGVVLDATEPEANITTKLLQEVNTRLTASFLVGEG